MAATVVSTEVEAASPDHRPACAFCGEPEELGLWDIWTDGNFTLATCCEALLEHVAGEMHAEPAWARELLRRLGAEEVTGHRLRRVCDGEGGTPMLDHKLVLRDIPFAAACRFISAHHRHCGPPQAWRFGQAVLNGAVLLGVVTVGNPVAPALMRSGMVEVNRLCIRRDVAPMLRADACSKLYAYAAREAERRGFAHIVSYSRADESGASLTAAGWEREALVRGRGWHSARRRRSNTNAYVDKVRWGRALRPKPVRLLTLDAAAPAVMPDWMRAGA